MIVSLCQIFVSTLTLWLQAKRAVAVHHYAVRFLRAACQMPAIEAAQGVAGRVGAVHS